MPYKIGAQVEISKEHIENYPECEGKKLMVTYSSRSGIGYDEAMYPAFLYDVSGVGFDFSMALYGFEIKRSSK